MLLSKKKTLSVYMSDEGDLGTSIQHVGDTKSRTRHPSKLSLPQKGLIQPRWNTKSRNKVVTGLRDRTYEERFKVLEKEG